MRSLLVLAVLALGAGEVLADFCDAHVSRIKRDGGKSTAVVSIAQGAWIDTHLSVAVIVTRAYVRSRILRTVELSCACSHEEQPCRCLLRLVNAEVDAVASREGLTPIHD